MKSLKLKLVVSLLVILIIGIWGVYQHYFDYGPDLELDSCSNSQYGLQIFAGEIETFIKKFHDPAIAFKANDLRGEFSIHEGQSADLYGASDLVYILWITGELQERTNEQGRAEWAELLRSYQDSETGLFSRNIVAGESITHATAFATAALRLLGSKPQYPHQWADEIFNSKASIDKWLDSFNWHEIWTGSHEMGRAAALIDAPAGVDLPDGWRDWLIEAMTARNDPKTGFWKNGIMDFVLVDTTTIDLGGAAHFWWIYHHLGQPIPHPEKVIDGIISLQKKSGIWGNKLFNGPFPQGIDFDAVNGFRYAYGALPVEKQSQYREKILKSLNIYACAVNRFLNQPGAIHRYYHSAHKLVGTLNAIAETNQLHIQLTGTPIFLLPKNWQSTLNVISWQ